MVRKPTLPKVSKTSSKDNPEAVMSIGDHLREARNRLFISAVAVLIGAIVGYMLFDPVYSMIIRPITLARQNGANLTVNFGTILSSFDMRLRISIWTGVLLASPVWMYEFWAYVGPGMTRKEKLYTWGYGVIGLLLFAAGCALGIWIMPHAVQILTGFIPNTASASGVMDASTYLSFYLRLVVVFGVAFLLPELLVALNNLGLMKGRTMLKGWRWAVVAIFTFMAFANPLPDPWSMILMAVPITGLYFLACFISIQHDKRVERRRAKEDAELDAALAKPSPAPATVSTALPAPQPAAQVEAAPVPSAAQIEPASTTTAAEAPETTEVSEVSEGGEAADEVAAPADPTATAAELPVTPEAPEAPETRAQGSSSAS